MRWMMVAAVGMLVGGADAAVLCARKSGALKLRETCKGKETVVDPVALGLQGPAGATGATGPSEIIITEAAAVTGFDNHFTQVAALALEPGDYLIVGKVWVSDYSNMGFQEYDCRLVVGGDVGMPIDEASESLGQATNVGVHSGAIVVTNTLSLAETTVVDMRCANNGGAQSGANRVKLMAVRTGGITRQ